jgi:hypothetical protein
MFSQFVSGSRKRRRGEAPWKNYTAYEIRIVGALVRLGWRDEAEEFLEFYLSDCRPKGWNQWPEISWRNPRSPGHLGDVPHTWIGAEYIHVFASLFAYERDSDAALVVAAGVPGNWISPRPLSVIGLPTRFGQLDLSMRRLADHALRIEISGDLAVPPGGIVLRPPLPEVMSSIEVDGARMTQNRGGEICLDRVPAVVRVSWTAGPRNSRNAGRQRKGEAQS